MKRFIKSKKGIALLATLVVAAVAAFGAYAYLTTGGSGSGSATSGSTTNNLAIQGPCASSVADQSQAACAGVASISVGSGLLPGQSVPVSYSIYNPNSYSVKIASVSAFSIVQSDSTCNAAPLNAEFHYADGAGANGVTIAPNSVSANFSGTLSEDNDPSNNQDSCEAPNSTTLTLHSS